VTDVRALLGLYRATADTVEDLVTLARTARERRWWTKYRDVLSTQYQEFIGFEADAVRLRQFHPTLVPGLLQIEPYIRAVTAALMLSPLPEAQYESLVEVRLRRQREILGSGEPPEFSVVIDEAALRRPIGGVEAMRAQVQHLAEMQSAKGVSIAILPFSAGPHVGLLGAFHIMEFSDEADEDVLYLETATQGDVAYRDRSEVLHRYSEHFERMLDASLQGAAAVDFLAKVAKESG
jgi:hypothetical protein